MKPSDVVLGVPPLVGTMRQAEIEHAAALIVRACQVLGDRWQPITPAQARDVWQGDINAKQEPFASLAHNPFFQPDVHTLVARGFATMDANKGVELTQAGLEALRPWVRAESRAP